MPAAPNFAYLFIKFEEKNPAYLFISVYLFIRELRVPCWKAKAIQRSLSDFKVT